ncbi:hypothetical protein [Luteibacter sp. ME-Dv--P-043b]|uniref:hypothetical protein n=1 Tax=Luteibacter sp. ME-Dv--P-043b TaxID=3040291 RepID=UPI002556AFCA|nr:hypothetical protein [Luteibacter sp. ME-Dv--P-043b]
MKLSVNLGLPTILTVVFAVLKLCSVIAWSWWLVFLPLFLGLGFTIFVVVLVVMAVAFSDWS